jgi:hypothetical protein
MARGDFRVFNAFWGRVGEGEYDLASDGFKLGIVDDTITPTLADTTPTWSDYSTNEVSGTNYTAGGISLTSVTWTEVTAGVWMLDSANMTVTYSASGFGDGYWGILYDDTHGSDEAIGFLDLGGPTGNDAEDLDINVPTEGWLRIQRKAA